MVYVVIRDVPPLSYTNFAVANVEDARVEVLRSSKTGFADPVSKGRSDIGSGLRNQWIFQRGQSKDGLDFGSNRNAAPLEPLVSV